jgi:protein-tyrosine phosphatase
MRGRTGLDLVGRYWEEGYSVIVHHIDDLHVPRDVAAFCRLVDHVHELLMCGNRVAIHCHAGIGRTGILMACLATRHCGMNPSEAVATVRAQVRGAIQTDEQAGFVTRAISESPPQP